MGSATDYSYWTLALVFRDCGFQRRKAPQIAVAPADRQVSSPSMNILYTFEKMSLLILLGVSILVMWLIKYTDSPAEPEATTSADD